MTNQFKSALFAFLGAMTLTIISCAKTSNSGTTSSTPASTCTTGSDGISRDQYGRTCANYAATTNSCASMAYNASTGQYYSPTTGQVVNCQATGFTDGYNSLPANGIYGGQQVTGCAGWTAQTGVQYVPIDSGNGVLQCINVNYLQQYNPGYDWSQYAAQQIPLYTCSGYDCNGGYDSGYQSNGYDYGCSTSINFGVSLGGLIGIGGGLCLPNL